MATAPPRRKPGELAQEQIAGIKDAAVMPTVADLKISNDDLRKTIETNQLCLMNERGSDLTFCARPAVNRARLYVKQDA